MFYAKAYKDNKIFYKGLNYKDHCHFSNVRTFVIYFYLPAQYDFKELKINKGKYQKEALERFKKEIRERVSLFSNKDFDKVEIHYCRVNSKKCPIKINMSDLSKYRNNHKITHSFVNYTDGWFYDELKNN